MRPPITAVDGAADHELVAAPGMVGAVPVRGQGPPEIGLRKRGDAVLDTEFDGRIVKRRHGITDAPEQPRLVLVLVVVRIESAGCDEEDLALHLQVVAGCNQAGHGLQLGTEL